MALVGFFGIVTVVGLEAGLTSLSTQAYSTVASWSFTVFPMFIFMGFLAFYAGFTQFAYDAAYKWVGRLPGGLGIATQMGAAAFGACCGSSIAATGALGKIAVPEMERFKYSKRLTAGTIATAGTLSALIPPSALLIIYGIITEESIGELLVAGLIPGVLTATMFSLVIIFWAKRRPGAAPKGEAFSWKERLKATPKAIPMMVIFIAVFGGIYTGFVTPTEAGALGAFVVLVLSLIMRQMNWMTFQEALFESLRSFCSVMVIVVGAHVFAQFMTLTMLPFKLADWVVALPISRMGIFAGIVVLYLILGMFLDAMGLILLTVPFLFPALMALGFDPIWFGVIVVKLAEIGLITPPVGIQTYVLKGVAPNLSLSDIALGFLPFIIVDLVITLTLLTAFPQIVLFLPSTMK